MGAAPTLLNYILTLKIISQKGLGIEKLSKLLSHFFILNYEWASPVPSGKFPKTGFQTPLAKNVCSFGKIVKSVEK